MNNLLEQLQQVPDYRHIRGRRHELWLVLFVILLGAMTGYWGYRPLEDFTKIHKQSLIELLNLNETIKFPSYSTFRRVLKTVDFQPLTDLFNNWASVFVPPMPHEESGHSMAKAFVAQSQITVNPTKILSVQYQFIVTSAALYSGCNQCLIKKLVRWRLYKN